MPTQEDGRYEYVTRETKCTWCGGIGSIRKTTGGDGWITVGCNTCSTTGKVATTEKVWVGPPEQLPEPVRVLLSRSTGLPAPRQGLFQSTSSAFQRQLQGWQAGLARCYRVRPADVLPFLDARDTDRRWIIGWAVRRADGEHSNVLPLHPIQGGHHAGFVALSPPDPYLCGVDGRPLCRLREGWPTISDVQRGLVCGHIASGSVQFLGYNRSTRL